MLFISLTFIIFFAIVYSLYLSLRHKAQNVLIIVAGYIFYGWWDWRFLGLLLLTTATDFIASNCIEATTDERKRKLYVLLSVSCNLGVLFFFKYFNFFSASAIDLLTMLGMKPDPFTLKVILPIGISFYTFQSLSFTIDVYRRQIKPTRDVIDFCAFCQFLSPAPGRPHCPRPRSAARDPEKTRHLLRSLAQGDLADPAWLFQEGRAGR